VRQAVAAGATAPNPPQDHGYMYQHGFADLDGHQWELFWMDLAAAPAQMQWRTENAHGYVLLSPCRQTGIVSPGARRQVLY
jgi:hypothetical protein